jgi:hypothetical protein
MTRLFLGEPVREPVERGEGLDNYGHGRRDLFFDVLFSRDNPVAPLIFSRIQGIIRFFHDLFERQVGLHQGRHADADGEPHRAVGGVNLQRLQCLTEAFGRQDDLAPAPCG